MSILQTVELTPEMGVVKLPTGVFGPLPPHTVGLLIGRSSSILKGLQVHLGVIDSDYKGEIQIMAQAHKPISLKEGQRIAQLLLLPYFQFPSRRQERTRGFGSTGKHIFWETLVTQQKPLFPLEVEGQIFQGLVDTGADVSIIASDQWPLQCRLRGVSKFSILELSRAGWSNGPSPILYCSYCPKFMGARFIATIWSFCFYSSCF